MGSRRLRASDHGCGPVPAVAKLFAKTSLGFADMDLVNEAFACQVLGVLRTGVGTTWTA